MVCSTIVEHRRYSRKKTDKRDGKQSSQKQPSTMNVFSSHGTNGTVESGGNNNTVSTAGYLDRSNSMTIPQPNSHLDQNGMNNNNRNLNNLTKSKRYSKNSLHKKRMYLEKSLHYFMIIFFIILTIFKDKFF